MTKHRTNPKVDAYLRRAKTWQQELQKLRRVMLAGELAEELKWGKPCYTVQRANVAIIIPLKESVALMFCKGALLKDPKGILLKPGANTQAGRWVKFTSAREIARLEPTLKAYLSEAVEVEKAGLKVEFKKHPEPVPAELQTRFSKSPALKRAFEALTPGRQRAYILYFSAAKQSKTREARIDKWMPQILKGNGLND